MNTVMCVRKKKLMTEKQCEVCKGIPAHIRAVTRKGDYPNWNKEPCARDIENGMTAEESIAKITEYKKPVRPLIHRPNQQQVIQFSDRNNRQAFLCCNVENVIEFQSCCGGKKRPRWLKCNKRNKVAWASCLQCADYKPSVIAVTVRMNA
jgi:hypothetical protein